MLHYWIHSVTVISASSFFALWRPFLLFFSSDLCCACNVFNSLSALFKFHVLLISIPHWGRCTWPSFGTIFCVTDNHGMSFSSFYSQKTFDFRDTFTGNLNISWRNIHIINFLKGHTNISEQQGCLRIIKLLRKNKLFMSAVVRF